MQPPTDQVRRGRSCSPIEGRTGTARHRTPARRSAPASPTTDATASRASAREAILDGAERVFATHGYEGAGMRSIAEEAQVAQALLHYHFGTKEALFEAVLARRAAENNEERQHRLRDLLREVPAPPLEAVLEIMMLRPSGDGHGGFDVFRQIVAGLSVAGDERSAALIAKHYDPIARAFVDAFQRAVPGLDRAGAVWAYLFALGTRVQGQAPPDRALRLLRPETGPIPPSEALLIPFLAAGIRGMAAALAIAPERAADGRHTPGNGAARVRGAAGARRPSPQG